MNSQLAFVAPEPPPDTVLVEQAQSMADSLALLPEAEQVATLNEIRRLLPCGGRIRNPHQTGMVEADHGAAAGC